MGHSGDVGEWRRAKAISRFKDGTAQKVSNALLSGAAGVASFLFSLAAFIYITSFNEQVLASIVAGAFCLMVSYIASERPNSESARALTARPAGGAQPYMAVALAVNDPVLDAMGYSRGRFIVEMPPLAPLVVPSWAEVQRVTEDCRR